MPENKSQVQAVELIPASFWTCPNCGTDQFERSVVYESSPEKMREIRQELGVEPWQGGELLTDPDEVECKTCREIFHTESFRA